MRQLTSLDSQFLALETRRQTGHVASVAILDPSTTATRTLAAADIQALIAARLPAKPRPKSKSKGRPAPKAKPAPSSKSKRPRRRA